MKTGRSEAWSRYMQFPVCPLARYLAGIETGAGCKWQKIARAIEEHKLEDVASWVCIIVYGFV